jgi:hypothetical protein
MRNAVAHGTRADHCYTLDVHESTCGETTPSQDQKTFESNTRALSPPDRCP